MSEQKYLLGIDVGTTGTKVTIFDTAGNPVASAYQEYECIYPKPAWVEQDANMLVETVYACCQKTLQSGAYQKEIAAVSVSAQRSCAVYVDAQGQPVKMISWMDNRTVEQVEEICRVIGRQRYYDITGFPPATTWILPKVMHTRQYDPETWNRTAKVLQLHDLIIQALGVDGYYTDEAEAGFFGLWDSQNLCYSDELFAAFQIDKSMFPDIRHSGDVVGRVTQAAAAKTGLLPGTPICIGVGDQNSAAIGAGIVKPGYISISLGTGGLATTMLEQCYRDPKGQAMVSNHAIHGKWTFEGLQNAAAGAFRWLRDEIFALEKKEAAEKGKNAYDTLNQMIEATPPGANGLLMLPYLSGSAAPRWDPLAKGGILGLTFAHGRADLARACVEGITLEQKDIMESLVSNGVTFELARIIGGATNSEVWNQIQADVYGIPCETLKVKDAAVLGAAICAGVGAGIFASVQDGVAQMVHVDKRYMPRQENSAFYMRLYDLYCRAYQSLADGKVFETLHQIQQEKEEHHGLS